jgi:hypothetical protein
MALKWQLKLKVVDTLKVLDTNIYILNVEQDSTDGPLVTFSDGTVAGYLAEELLLLRPLRERVEDYPNRTGLPIPA